VRAKSRTKKAMELRKPPRGTHALWLWNTRAKCLTMDCLSITFMGGCCKMRSVSDQRSVLVGMPVFARVRLAHHVSGEHTASRILQRLCSTRSAGRGSCCADSRSISY
jgi:hypothetical protein